MAVAKRVEVASAEGKKIVRGVVTAGANAGLKHEESAADVR